MTVINEIVPKSATKLWLELALLIEEKQWVILSLCLIHIWEYSQNWYLTTSVPLWLGSMWWWSTEIGQNVCIIGTTVGGSESASASCRSLSMWGTTTSTCWTSTMLGTPSIYQSSTSRGMPYGTVGEEHGLYYGVKRGAMSRSGISQNPQTPTPNLTPTKNNKSHVL